MHIEGLERKSKVFFICSPDAFYKITAHLSIWRLKKINVSNLLQRMVRTDCFGILFPFLFFQK